MHSLYFATGGHLGRRALADLVEHTTSHRTARVADAPSLPGEFLVHHFDRSDEDRSWYRYLVEEALALGSGPVPFEDERRPVIQLQVDEVRRRQAEGVVAPEFDPPRCGCWPSR
jgi:hypothetical protein